jgi:phosphatidylglycerophosphate synthase
MLGAALAIQLRLLCNLFDGMVAVEGGQATPAGAVWNDLPDRLADPLILVPVGYAITVPWGVELGWLAGVLAVLTAYVRVLGGALGLPQDFRGPLAKPQRMAVLTVAWLGAILEELLGGAGWVLVLALLIIALGSGITALRRTRHLVRALERGAAA